MQPKAWYLSAALVALCILSGMALYRVVSSTAGAMNVLLDNAIGKPASVAVAELKTFVRTDLLLAASDMPFVALVYRTGTTPTPVPVPDAIVALGVDEQGIVRQVMEMNAGMTTIPTSGDVQVVPL